jgi:hypothetical protein
MASADFSRWSVSPEPAHSSLNRRLPRRPTDCSADPRLGNSASNLVAQDIISLKQEKTGFKETTIHDSGCRCTSSMIISPLGSVPIAAPTKRLLQVKIFSPGFASEFASERGLSTLPRPVKHSDRHRAKAPREPLL